MTFRPFWQDGWIRPALILPQLIAQLRNPTLRADGEALLFSAKSFAAAMLAYFIALRIGLPRPAWAIVTVYLVSQPTGGASLSRGLYRLMGTLAGALATVTIVPTFANEPVVCSAVLAGWIGLGLFLSLLDRTPRSYAFVLSGYTTSLIGFPAVAAPAAVFDTAIVRVQEIALGILCAVVIHRYVFPRPMTGQFQAKLAATLHDARRLACDVLNNVSESSCRDDRYRMALDMLALRGLATHLPYDPVTTRLRGPTLRTLHDRLAHLLLLLADVEERISLIHAPGMPEKLAQFLYRVRRWITLDTPNDRGTEAHRVFQNARSFGHADDATLIDGLVANIARHLAELVGLLHDIERLGAEASAAECATEPFHGHGKTTGYVFHRDPMMAARAGLGAALGILFGCFFWIWSAWPDGGLAVSVLGVTCALFGNVDAPVPYVRKYMLGSVYGIAISLIYSFTVLPRVFEFSVLIAVLAPAFLFGGSLQARPSTAFMALGITLTVPILVGLGPVYGGDFAEAINSSIALLMGVGFGAATMTLFQTVSPDTAINRLLRLGRRDAAYRVRSRVSTKAVWTNLTIDRIALLRPRLSLSARPTTETIDMIVHDLRIGHAVSRLREQFDQLESEPLSAIQVLLLDLAHHFDRGSPSVDELNTQVEELIARIVVGTGAHRHLLDPLIDLRFALSSVQNSEARA